MDNSQISASYFNVTFNPDDRSLRYAIDLTTEINSYVTAHVQVYAYGFLIIEKDIDMCTIGWKQFCPIYPGTLQIDSIQYISSEYTDQIPGIAYQVPDIDAVAKIIVRDRNTGTQLSCIQASFTNGKTISQTGVKWATAVIAGLGLIVASMLSTFGNSNAASHISANALSLFLYFQSVVVVSMQAVDRVPPIASAWSENLAWSMGLIRITFMQDIFRWYVQSTGGTPSTYFIATTKQILVQKRKRSLDYVAGVAKRSLEYSLRSNRNLIVLRGIKRIGFNSKIEPTSIVATGYTWFALIGYLLVVLLVFVKSIVVILTRAKKVNPRSFNAFRGSFSNLIKGSLLRYIAIGSTQLTLFSLWEFTQNDSPALMVLAALFIALLVTVLGWSFFNVLRIGRRSIREYNNPAALLYGDSKVLDKFGFCYTMFHADKYWFGIVLMSYNAFKTIFIAFCQDAGKVSVWPVFVADMAYTASLFYFHPFLNKPTNITNYLIHIVQCINSFLFLFFSDIFNQAAPVSSIMGWVFFILNAAFSLILLILVIVFVIMSVISKNPDARFAPAKDDRFSFQRKSSVKNNRNSDIKQNNELDALGIAAQEHNPDWESQMYKLHDMSLEDDAGLNRGHEMTVPDYSNSSDYDDDYEEEVDQEKDKNQKLATKWKNKLTRKLSRKKSTKNKNNTTTTTTTNVRRLSDTLNHNDELNSDERRENYDELAPISVDAYNQRAYHTRGESSASSLSNNNPTNAKGFI
ncbi:FLC3 putative flavin carrier protein 3 [Candida maltosa Xu316]